LTRGGCSATKGPKPSGPPARPKRNQSRNNSTTASFPPRPFGKGRPPVVEPPARGKGSLPRRLAESLCQPAHHKGKANSPANLGTGSAAGPQQFFAACPRRRPSSFRFLPSFILRLRWSGRGVRLPPRSRRPPPVVSNQPSETGPAFVDGSGPRQPAGWAAPAGFCRRRAAFGGVSAHESCSVHPVLQAPNRPPSIGLRPCSAAQAALEEERGTEEQRHPARAD